jgi:hypothetical protein
MLCLQHVTNWTWREDQRLNRTHLPKHRLNFSHSTRILSRCLCPSLFLSLFANPFCSFFFIDHLLRPPHCIYQAIRVLLMQLRRRTMAMSPFLRNPNQFHPLDQRANERLKLESFQYFVLTTIAPVSLLWAFGKRIHVFRAFPSLLLSLSLRVILFFFVTYYPCIPHSFCGLSFCKLIHAFPLCLICSTCYSEL